MARRMKVAPTKSKLLQLKDQVGFLEKGHSLLERKRELLTRLVYERLDNYRALRRKAQTLLEEAYRALAVTYMRMGSKQLRQTLVGLDPAIEIRILPRSSLGVQYLSVKAHELALQPVSMLGTDASFDEARRRMTELAVVLAELGEAETALRRLLIEQRKTQKRVNALKYNVIPRYEETIHYIQSALEEEERMTLFQIKLLHEREA